MATVSIFYYICLRTLAGQKMRALEKSLPELLVAVEGYNIDRVLDSHEERIPQAVLDRG